ncbi:hypothetical protein [Metabacillus fastidiosus]|uniref:hypothetical protein n=1 Tax=Metabacillus fastidiosus TaxID=1458 RepID=UPI003D2C8190
MSTELLNTYQNALTYNQIKHIPNEVDKLKSFFQLNKFKSNEFSKAVQEYEACKKDYSIALRICGSIRNVISQLQTQGII